MTNIETVAASLTADKPVLILDADEVLLRFVEHLEHFFSDEGFELRLTSFQLNGNIYHKDTDRIAKGSVVKDLIGAFFDQRVDSVPAVEGAANALQSLREQYQITILTNVPHHCRSRRERALHDMGFDYPVISNAGEKGPSVSLLQSSAGKPAVFVDDLPPQLASVASHAPHVHRVHFVADPRLARMIDKAPDAHVRIDDWLKLGQHLHERVMM